MYYTTNENNVIQLIKFNESGEVIKSKQEAQRIKDTYYPGYFELKETLELNQSTRIAI